MKSGEVNKRAEALIGCRWAGDAVFAVKQSQVSGILNKIEQTPEGGELQGRGLSLTACRACNCPAFTHMGCDDVGIRLPKLGSGSKGERRGQGRKVGCVVCGSDGGGNGSIQVIRCACEEGKGSGW